MGDLPAFISLIADLGVVGLLSVFIWALATKRLRFNHEIVERETWYAESLKERETWYEAALAQLNKFAEQMKQERDDWQQAYLAARVDTKRAIETTKTAVEAAVTKTSGVRERKSE